MTEQTKVKIGSPRFKQAEQVRNEWRITLEENTTRKDVEDPAFWSIIAKNLKAYDIVEINNDDSSVFARALVIEAGRNYASIKILEWHDLTKEVVKVNDNRFEQFKVKYKGPHHKFCVIRLVDNEVLEKEMEKTQAEEWLRKNINTIAA